MINAYAATLITKKYDSDAMSLSLAKNMEYLDANGRFLQTFRNMIDR